MERNKFTHQSSPHVLPTESLTKLEEDRRGIRETLNPQNALAEIYADQFAYENLFTDRFRRAMSRTVKEAHALRPNDRLGGRVRCIPNLAQLRRTIFMPSIL
jgi:hypothetical protein